jgi:hypothetical protein
MSACQVPAHSHTSKPISAPIRSAPREIEITGAPDAVERAFGMVMEIINSDGNANTQSLIQKVRTPGAGREGERRPLLLAVKGG